VAVIGPKEAPGVGDLLLPLKRVIRVGHCFRKGATSLRIRRKRKKAFDIWS